MKPCGFNNIFLEETMKAKSVFLVVLIVCLALPVFAGGGKQGGASSAADIGFNATGYPVVTKPFSFTAVQMRRTLHGPYDKMEVLQEMEKKTGIHVEWIEIPEASFRERINLLLAGNDLPDVFMTGPTDSDIVRYGPTGTLIPMDNLIDKYAPLITGLFTQKPEIKKYVTAPDGHVYILPRYQELAFRNNYTDMFINKIWLDKLGLAIPTTYDELYTVLKAFKERDPNGNGKRDELPMSWCSNWDFTSLFGSLGAYDTVNADHVVVNNRKVSFTANTPEYRDALVYFNKLYSEGLIDPEVFTQDSKQFYAKGVEKDALFGVFFDYIDENAVGYDRARSDYVMLPPLKGPGGKQVWNINVHGGYLSRENFSITSKMKNPEVAIRWADLCYDRDISPQLCLGPFGIVIRWEGSRVIQVEPPAGMTSDEFRFQHAPAHTTPFAVYQSDYDRMNVADYISRKLVRYETYRKYFPSTDTIFPPVYYLPQEESELAIIRTDIDGFVRQSRARFITGDLSITSGWNTYLQQLNQMNLPRYLEIAQKALDRYNAN
jgi:putative aldouronate transport system substrate-binding protein